MTTHPLRQQPPGQPTAAERLGFTEAPPPEPEPEPESEPRTGPAIPAGPMGTPPDDYFLRAALRAR
jgi:hypothetical protein